MNYINPRVDIAFKKIFGVEENKDLLISLINSIVSKEDQISEVILLNPYNPKNFQNDKLSILDIKAKSIEGKMFNIEIQISDEADYDKRALYYWAKLYTEQLKAGEDYSSLSKAIGIHILNFTSIPEVSEYHNVFHITEKQSGISYFKDLELHTIELKKFTENVTNELSSVLSQVKTSLDSWVAFLTKYNLLNKEDLPELQGNSKNIKKALSVLEYMNFSEYEREEYESHLKWLRIQTNTIKKYERDARAEGLAKGLAEGKMEGLAEGEARGIEKIALKMLGQGLGIELIQQATELSESQISDLLTKTQKK